MLGQVDNMNHITLDAVQRCNIVPCDFDDCEAQQQRYDQQTASIVGGAPLLIVALLLCFAIVKVARHDIASMECVQSDVIHVTDLPEQDPWMPADDRGSKSQK